MLNAAILGCGEMGKTHAECIQNIEDINLIACCDSDLLKAKNLQEQYQVKIATEEVMTIFNNPDIAVVYITTPTDSHLPLCLSAIHNGKHVFIEKPLAVKIDEAFRIHQEAENTKKVVMVGLKFRFYSMIQKARQLMPNPFMVTVQVLDNPWLSDFWANDPVLGGGNVISQGVHGSDLLRFLANSDPVQVFASGANYHQTTGVIDNLAATFSFKNGVAGSLVVGDTGQPPLLGKFCVQIFGSEGTLILTERLTHLEFHSRNSNEIFTFIGCEDGFLEENRAFVKAIKESHLIYSTTWDGFVAQAMIDSAIRTLSSKQAEQVLPK